MTADYNSIARPCSWSSKITVTAYRWSFQTYHWLRLFPPHPDKTQSSHSDAMSSCGEAHIGRSIKDCFNRSSCALHIASATSHKFEISRIIASWASTCIVNQFNQKTDFRVVCKPKEAPLLLFTDQKSLFARQLISVPCIRCNIEHNGTRSFEFWKSGDLLKKKGPQLHSNAKGKKKIDHRMQDSKF